MFILTKVFLDTLGNVKTGNFCRVLLSKVKSGFEEFIPNRQPENSLLFETDFTQPCFSVYVIIPLRNQSISFTSNDFHELLINRITCSQCVFQDFVCWEYIRIFQQRCFHDLRVEYKVLKYS